MLSIFKFYRKWKRVGKGRREKASVKKKPQGLLRLKSSPRNCFLPSFLFFLLLDVKITKKILSRKQKPQYIYYIHLAAAPVYLQKTLSSLYMYKLLILEVFFFLSSDSCIENSWRTKVDFRRGLGYLIFLHFPKELTYFQPKRKKLVFIFNIYLYICNVFFKATLTPFVLRF